jgi:HEAT repeat protein
MQRDKAQIVRAAAAAALGKIAVESAVDALAAVLKRPPGASDEYLRRTAARSIGQIAEHSRHVIISVATPRDFLPTKYKPISQSSNYLPAPAAFRTPLRILLKVASNQREDNDTRREAAFALGAIGDPSAKPFLSANVNSEDTYLAEICREALLKISDP